jgi:arginine N-succinyltransferase
MLLSHGRLHDFVACYGKVEVRGDQALLDPEARRLLGVKDGDTIQAVAR